MDRRDFFKVTAAGSAGLAGLPALGDMLARTPRVSAADGMSNFHFVCVSRAGVLEGADHWVATAGTGMFNAGTVEGSGPLLHWNNAPAGTPKPVIAAGTWTAKRVVNFAPYGTAISLAAGILDLEAEANVEAPAPATIPFRLRIVCNIGPAGIMTGQPEGVVLSVPGTPFVKENRFKPLQPEVGLTVFTPGAETAGLGADWEAAFEQAHGTKPTPQDKADRLWSLDFQARTGREPSNADWVARSNAWQAYLASL